MKTVPVSLSSEEAMNVIKYGDTRVQWQIVFETEIEAREYRELLEHLMQQSMEQEQ